jgi:hypothetical protein
MSDDDPDVEGMVRDVDEGMDELAETVAGDVADLLDARTEYVASGFEYDNRTHEKSVTVRVDIGLAEELRGRYEGVKLGDGGGIELRMTIDADRA